MGDDWVREVDQFILDEIDTVPHLEALLLLWNNQSKEWTPEELAKAIYLSLDATRSILGDLERQGFVALTGKDRFRYRSSARDSLIGEVDRIYRREVVRIATMIHAKPSASLREFARAFRLKRDRD